MEREPGANEQAVADHLRTTAVLATVSALEMAIEEMAAPYIPPPGEAALLEAALVKLIAAYERRDFNPGEEAVWNCGSITIGGEHKGAWEIRLRQIESA